MKEDVLRKMIRKQIKSSLQEATPGARSQVASTLGRVEKMAGVKMLKKALGTGSSQQQAAGLLAVVNAISGENPQVAKLLGRMLMKAKETPGDVGMPAGAADRFESVQEAETSSALSSKMTKLDKTQQMKMLKQALGNKPANMQTDFVIDLIKGLGLKKAAKQRLLLKMRAGLKG